jgi:GT2 family glycosyltransferase
VTVTVVTPWLNHRELERGYWAAMRCCDFEVLVVDNGSSPPLANGVRSDRNIGFAAASNLGLSLARTDAVLFLNNDIRPTRPDWSVELKSALEPGVLVGAQLRNGRHAAVDGVDFPYLDGWCLAGMRDDLLALDGFDESFDEPSYYGDNDLCLRARLQGMTLRQADVGLVHLANATAGPGTQPNVAAASRANYQRYATRARQAMKEAVAA